MADAKTKIVIDVGEGAKSLRTLKQEFKENQKALDGLIPGTKDYVAQLKKLGDIKDEISDLNTEINAFRPDQKLASFVGVARGIAAGFEAATAASALFGSEAEDVEKAILKVQSAMALANAVQEVGELGENFKLLGTTIKAAFASNPFTAILVAVTGLAAILGGVSDKYFGISAIAKEELETQKKVVAEANERLNLIEGSTAQLKLQGKSERQILEIKKKQTDEIIEQTMLELQKEIQVREAQAKTAEANKTILTRTLQFISAPITLLLKTVDYIAEALGTKLDFTEKVFGSISGLMFDPEETRKEGQKEIDETLKTLQALKEKRAGYVLEIQGIDKKTSEDAFKKREEDAIREKERQANLAKSDDEAEAFLAEEQGKRDEADRLAEDAKAAEDAARLNESALTYEQTERQKTQDLLEQTQARNQIRQAEYQAAVSIVNSLGSLTEIMGVQGRAAIGIQKGLALAQIAIDTAQAFSSLTAESAKASAKVAGILGPATPAFTIAYYAAGVARILANIARAKAVLSAVPGGGGGGGSLSGGGGGGSVRPPQLNQVSNTSTNLDNLRQGDNKPNVVKAVVVETDITNSQKRIKKIEDKTKH